MSRRKFGDSVVPVMQGFRNDLLELNKLLTFPFYRTLRSAFGAKIVLIWTENRHYNSANGNLQLRKFISDCTFYARNWTLKKPRCHGPHQGSSRSHTRPPRTGSGLPDDHVRHGFEPSASHYGPPFLLVVWSGWCKGDETICIIYLFIYLSDLVYYSGCFSVYAFCATKWYSFPYLLISCN